MKNLFYILALLFAVQITHAQETPESNCITCHQLWEDEDGPSFTFQKDAHFQRGLSCNACHGGDPSLDDMDKVRQSADWIGVPDTLDIPDFCARCHSNPEYMRAHNPSIPVDQLDKYKISIHGERLFNKKDTKVATCVSCHTAHSIADAKLPYSTTYAKNIPYTCGKCHADTAYMKQYHIPTDQLKEYVGSVHGVALLQNDDLGAPACNDCHSNHGASPPGISTLAAVCGVCHAIEASLYEQSPHEAAFEMADFPMCETCHSNHGIKKPSDPMIGMTGKGICGECHSPDDGTTAAETVDKISTGITELKQADDTVRVLLANVRHKGMMTTDIEFLLKDVDQSIIQARTRIHAFNADSVMPKVKTGIDAANKAREQAASLIGEYYFRRKGLIVATIIITLLVIMLFFKIRKIEGR